MTTTIKIPEYKTTIQFSGIEQYALVFPPKYGYSPLFYADEFETAAEYLEFRAEGYKGIEIKGAQILSITNPSTGLNEAILSVPYKRLLLTYSEGEMLRSLFQTVKEREVRRSENQ